MGETTAIRAKTRGGYLVRLVILTAAILGYGGIAFLYDGFIRYPQYNEMFQTYREIEQTYAASPQLREAKWQEVAQQRGWPVEFAAERAPHTASSIWTQRVIGIVATPIGLLLAFNLIRYLGRWVEWDGERLRTSWGQEASVEQVTRLNKARWKTKGIAVVEYQDERARARRLVLDDWKFNREGIAAIEKALEERLGPQKVTGGEGVVAGAAEGQDSEVGPAA